jgi:hypothetical protein
MKSRYQEVGLSNVRLGLVMVVVGWVTSGFALAAGITWDGGGADRSWNTAQS